MRDIKAICRDIVDCEDKLTVARTIEATDRDGKIAKEVESATIERQLVLLNSARASWIEGGRDIWLRSLKRHEARINGSDHPTE